MPLIVTYVWICDDCGEARQAGVLDVGDEDDVKVPYPGDGWSTWLDKVICPPCLARRKDEET